jgi:hypothetical protein
MGGGGDASHESRDRSVAECDDEESVASKASRHVPPSKHTQPVARLTLALRSRLSFHDMAGFDAVHARNRHIKLLFSKNAKGYTPDKVGVRKELPCPLPKEALYSSSYKGKLKAVVNVVQGTKVVCFSDSDYKVNESLQDQLKSGGWWRSAKTMVQVQGLCINLIDDVPQELLSVVLRDFEITKQPDNLEFSMRLRHLQIDNMVENAK